MSGARLLSPKSPSIFATISRKNVSSRTSRERRSPVPSRRISSREHPVFLGNIRRVCIVYCKTACSLPGETRGSHRFPIVRYAHGERVLLAFTIDDRSPSMIGFASRSHTRPRFSPRNRLPRPICARRHCVA